MPIGLLQEIKTRIPRNTSLLGMDIGTKTIGLSICNPDHTLATPLSTIKRTKFTKDILKLDTVIKTYEIGGYIVGLPLNTDGTEGPRCQSVRDFIHELIKYPDIVGRDPWIAFWDERYSTLAAKESVIFNTKNAKKSGLLDKLAAQTILQSALERMKLN